eukprot:12922035-Prorocentrum_lima.AAC.1
MAGLYTFSRTATAGLPSATLEEWQQAPVPMRVGAMSSMEAFGEHTAGIGGPAGAFNATGNAMAYQAEG